MHVYSWRPVIIVAFDFRTKCAVTDRIETAYIVDDLQLLLFEPNVTCMQGLEIMHISILNQGIRSGGGLNSLGRTGHTPIWPKTRI